VAGAPRALRQKFPEVQKYRVSLVDAGPETVADGIAEVWFDDMATLRRVTSSAWYRRHSGTPSPTRATASASSSRSIGFR